MWIIKLKSIEETLPGLKSKKLRPKWFCVKTNWAVNFTSHSTCVRCLFKKRLVDSGSPKGRRPRADTYLRKNGNPSSWFFMDTQGAQLSVRQYIHTYIRTSVPVHRDADWLIDFWRELDARRHFENWKFTSFLEVCEVLTWKT